MNWTEKIKKIFQTRRSRYRQLAAVAATTVQIEMLGEGQQIEQFSYWPQYQAPEYGTPCGDLWYDYTTEAYSKNYELHQFATDWRSGSDTIQEKLDDYVQNCVNIA
jgi:hypothetical protein